MSKLTREREATETLRQPREKYSEEIEMISEEERELSSSKANRDKHKHFGIGVLPLSSFSSSRASVFPTRQWWSKSLPASSSLRSWFSQHSLQKWREIKSSIAERVHGKTRWKTTRSEKDWETTMHSKHTTCDHAKREKIRVTFPFSICFVIE